jgi:hypothetical protein
MISWDKLTTREYVLERPEKMTVWNAYNREEAVQYHGFKAEDVRVTGIPQFDIYHQPERLPSRAEFMAAVGLDPDPACKLLLVTAQPGHVHKKLHKLVQILAQMMHSGMLSQSVQVLVRPHPSVYSGHIAGQGTEQDLQYYESLHPRIKGNRPRIASSGVWADTKAAEATVLATALHHAALVIDFYGTVSIEACMLDKPVMYIHNDAFGTPDDAVQSQQKARIDYTEYVHLQHAIQLGAGRIVHNADELRDTINAFLENPALDAEKRQQVVEKLCYANDGQSALRLAQAILDVANGRWAAR